MLPDITKTNCLTAEEALEVRALEARVRHSDALTGEAWLSAEMNFDREAPCFYLGRERGALVAFLLLFMPTRREAEVYAYTDPERRRRGYFSRLLAAARADLAALGVPDILFMAEAGSESAAAVVKAWGGLGYDHTEYRMEHRGAAEAYCGKLRFEAAADGNRARYLDLLIRANETPEPEALGYMEMVLASPERAGYLAFDGAEPVGVFHLLDEQDDCLFHGFAVLPALRGRGYGTEILRFALAEAKRRRPLTALEVDVNNPRALGLYTRRGFTPVFRMDYWRQSVASCG